MSVDTVGLDQLRAHVRVTGDLDVSTGAPLWAVLDGHLAAGRRFLRLDLSGVTFLDAAALTGISRAHRDALAVRGTLVLTGVRPRIVRLLRLTGLDDVLFVSGPHGDEPLPDTPAQDDPPPSVVRPARSAPAVPPDAAPRR
jgi:anti-sigma B factor antagonist